MLGFWRGWGVGMRMGVFESPGGFVVGSCGVAAFRGLGARCHGGLFMLWNMSEFKQLDDN